MILAHLAALATLQPPVAVVAVPPSPPSARVEPTAVARKLALEVATLLNSERKMMGEIRKLVAVDLPKAVAADAQYQELEKLHPDVSKVILAAMVPAMEKIMAARLPALWDEIATAYTSELTEAELRVLLDFYRSPTGTWLVESVLDNVDTSSILTETVQNPDYKLTNQDIRTSLAAGVTKSMATATPAQQRDLVQFGGSPAFRKLLTVNPKLMAITLKFANEDLSAAEEKLIEEAVVRAMTPFIERAEAANREKS